MQRKNRKILLIEPGYKNKYPPIGLMKIATYHRMLGDNVVFYKGSVKQFVFNQILEDCLFKLNEVCPKVDWEKQKKDISKFLKSNHSTKRDALLPTPKMEDKNFNEITNQVPLVEMWLKYFGAYYKNEKYKEEPVWDRVYVTTLFTFYWKITVEAIHEAKDLVKDLNELKVGGVLASLLTAEVEEETGIKPMTGILDKPGMLDEGNSIIVDDLPLDYSILDEIDYKYPTGSAYFTFMTKGCTRTCAFCSVPKLEPTYKEKIPTKDKFEKIKELYGEQQNLLLMDNNVLASPKFPEIIQDIKDMGFVKGAKFIEPNQLDIAIRNLKRGDNDVAYIKKCHSLLQEFLNKRVKGKTQQTVYDIYDKYSLLRIESVSKENLLNAYEELKDFFEQYRNKAPRNRYVDFNQGTDARYVTDENMKLISEIPIKPLRIAFDYWGLKKQYEKAVRLAAKYDINRLSNYLLFNFKDRPEDLWKRMHINMELSEELDIHIYSFPMKYIPLFGEEAKHRSYIGKFWNKKFIRAIQSISNVTRGIVPPERSFFEKAFGATEDEYFEIMYMPETFIIYRKLFEEELQLTPKWKTVFNTIKSDEVLWEEAKPILERSEFSDIESETKNPILLNFFEFYKINREDVKKSDNEYLRLKRKFDHLIKSDQFIDLTLTYDYE
ncbi:radical SAM protein [Flagellimonas sp.]|uniref:radical SAM protein n=1 Tax=Flagellimonas sp. TaxID=2058762 RepID=UPI003BA8E4EE